MGHPNWTLQKLNDQGEIIDNFGSFPNPRWTAEFAQSLNWALVTGSSPGEPPIGQVFSHPNGIRVRVGLRTFWRPKRATQLPKAPK